MGNSTQNSTRHNQTLQMGAIKKAITALTPAKKTTPKKKTIKKEKKEKPTKKSNKKTRTARSSSRSNSKKEKTHNKKQKKNKSESSSSEESSEESTIDLGQEDTSQDDSAGDWSCAVCKQIYQEAAILPDERCDMCKLPICSTCSVAFRRAYVKYYAEEAVEEEMKDLRSRGFGAEELDAKSAALYQEMVDEVEHDLDWGNGDAFLHCEKCDPEHFKEIGVKIMGMIF